MKNDENLQTILGDLVREEIRGILSTQRRVIREAVREELIPALRAIIREGIFEELGDLLENQPPGDKTPEPQKAQVSQDPEGLYVYGVVKGEGQLEFGPIGLDGKAVYTLAHRDLAALVHRAEVEVYASPEKELAEGWVLAHQKVVETANGRFCGIVPMGFGTIVRGDDMETPEEAVCRWLRQDYDLLWEKLCKIQGKAEYGVQIFWDTEVISQGVAAESDGIREIRDGMLSKPEGVAYLQRQRLEGLLKTAMEAWAKRNFTELYGRICRYAEEVRVEKAGGVGEEDGRRMLMNLNCLMTPEQCEALGEELERIAAMKGLSVVFTGPWPAYSFV